MNNNDSTSSILKPSKKSLCNNTLNANGNNSSTNNKLKQKVDDVEKLNVKPTLQSIDLMSDVNLNNSHVSSMQSSNNNKDCIDIFFDNLNLDPSTVISNVPNSSSSISNQRANITMHNNNFGFGQTNVIPSTSNLIQHNVVIANSIFMQHPPQESLCCTNNNTNIISNNKDVQSNDTFINLLLLNTGNNQPSLSTNERIHDNNNYGNGNSNFNNNTQNVKNECEQINKRDAWKLGENLVNLNNINNIQFGSQQTTSSRSSFLPQISTYGCQMPDFGSFSQINALNMNCI